MSGKIFFLSWDAPIAIVFDFFHSKMQQSLRSLKAYIRHWRKSGTNLLHGYYFDYAREQNNTDISPYKYQWSSFTTPIKKRSGVANINENRIL